MFSEFSSVTKSALLLLVGCLLASVLTVATVAPEQASAMEIDCSTIGGSNALGSYVDSFGVRCAGGGETGGSGTSGGGGSGCMPNTDKVPIGFFDVLKTGVENTEVVTRIIGGTTTTHIKVYRRDVNGREYLGGELRVWNGPRGSGISVYSYLFSRGGAGSFYQEAYYDSKMTCADGYSYYLTESLAAGTSPANPTPLVAPGVTATSDGSVMARGALIRVGSTDGYLLRLDVTNNNPTTPTPVATSLIVNDFDVESVLATSGGVDCPAPDKALQRCAIDEMAPGSTRSLTLLLRAHTGAPADADIPIILSYQTATAPTARWFYSASRPGAVVIDPVPTPPFCPADPDAHPVVAGLPSKLTTTCYDGLPMTVVAEHGTASISDYGALSYTSDPGYRGTDTLTVTASNAHGRVSDPTTIDVTVSDPPLAAADGFRVLYETPLTTTDSVLANDSVYGAAALPLPAGWYAQQGTTPPAHGVATVNRDGTFVYTPDKGFSGTDSFLYRLEGPDSAASNAVKVTLTVVVP